MVTESSGGGGSLLSSCGMTYAPQVVEDPDQGADLGSLEAGGMIVDLDHDETLQSFLDFFLLFKVDAKLPQNMQGHFNPQSYICLFTDFLVCRLEI